MDNSSAARWILRRFSCVCSLAILGTTRTILAVSRGHHTCSAGQCSCPDEWLLDAVCTVRARKLRHAADGCQPMRPGTQAQAQELHGTHGLLCLLGLLQLEVSVI